ncbi:P-loop NTPase fold protein [Escherichia coli]|uniref:P-loop NTPase fold protein n=1 Tax=Escherichia coli TaxID=562 RepID=UPI000989D620|nr:P-loop NTPase fold protein [Escherichia coli]
MWSDKESSEDYLNFGEVSQLAVDVLTTKDMLPVSIGIFGNWGAGKSSLLKLIEQKLEQDDKDWIVSKRLARTVLIFTERSDQLSRATDRVPGLPASPGYAQ